jgi:hypothetical protein
MFGAILEKENAKMERECNHNIDGPLRTLNETDDVVGWT